MLTDTGYGVYAENIEYKDDAPEQIYELFGPNMKARFNQELQDENEDRRRRNEDPISSTDFIPIFIEDYENDVYLWSDINGVICDVINENEFSEDVMFRYDNQCLYVSAEIPEDEAEKAKLLTKQQIRKILAKYLSPITKKEIVVEYVELYDI